ncbi:MAG: hypothetical protein ACYS8W_12190 [Planctomycetota bacterium]|jgi:hypothetical protein
MAKARDKKMIAGLVVIIVILLGVFGTLTFLLWRQNNDIKKEIASLQTKKSDFLRVEENVKQMNKELEGLKDFILRASQILPRRREALYGGFFKLYAKFIRESGVRNRALTPLGAAAVVGEFTRYRYKADVRGTFSQVVKFFREIESHERFFKIDSFEVRNSELGAGVWPDPEKHCSVIISTYTFRED